MEPSNKEDADTPKEQPAPSSPRPSSAPSPSAAPPQSSLPSSSVQPPLSSSPPSSSPPQPTRRPPPALHRGPPVPPPWMPPVPYPAGPMPYHMPPPHFMPPYMPYHMPMPYHPPPPSPSPSQSQGSSEDNRTIWVGDLQYWMDENYLHNCFGHTGEVVQLKVIRNKQTGQSEGYGFVEFISHSAAEKYLQELNGAMMPKVDQVFRINWASFSSGEKRADTSPDHSIFVGDLAADVTDTLLQETFSSKYQSVKGAKVVIDVNTGRSKGYGFVRFGDEEEKSRALSEMNGVFCSSRAMRVGAATPRKSSGSASTSSHGSTSGDSTNTTLFIGGLDPDVSDEELRQAFAQHGEIATVKIPIGKQCGFVQFVRRSSAEEALQKLNGTTLGKQTIRISWGRNPINKQYRSEPAIPWSNGYYGGPIYDPYGYGVPPPSPPMYSGAYVPYNFYGNQQQVI